MSATLTFHEKRLVPGRDGLGIAELKVWQLPASTRYPLGTKYSLFFSFDGEVLVGMDNHHPKGPHLHLGGREVPYIFASPEKLVADFWAYVRKEGFEP